MALFLCCSCYRPPEPASTHIPKVSTINVDYAIPAFGGQLLGTDRGESIGALLFKDATGNITVLLNENVQGMVQNQVGLFVFTGLAHLGTNDGFIYTVKRGVSNRLAVERLGRLPGAPSEVTQLADGTTTFLVFAGYKGEHQYFECYSLVGNVVSHSNACKSPKRR